MASRYHDRPANQDVIDKPSSFLELGFELTLSMIIFVTLMNLLLHFRIKYGDLVVTKKATMPYKIIFGFLGLALLENVIMIYVSNITYENDFERLTKSFLENEGLLLTIISIELCKFCILTSFIS